LRQIAATMDPHLETDRRPRLQVLPVIVGDPTQNPQILGTGLRPTAFGVKRRHDTLARLEVVCMDWKLQRKCRASAETDNEPKNRPDSATHRGFLGLHGILTEWQRALRKNTCETEGIGEPRL
jgi:hypothetical protein